jgi:hydroxymethylpyrimidine/phosphomethylpyrimidine kinase
LGLGLSEAVHCARQFIVQAIAHGADITTGHGHGPLNHGFAPVPMHALHG